MYTIPPAASGKLSSDTCMPPYVLLWAWPSCGHSLSQSATRADPGEKERKKEKREKKKEKEKKSKMIFARYGASAYPGDCSSINPRRYDSNQMLRLWSNSKSWNIDITWQWDFGALEIVYDIGYLLKGGIVVHTPDVPLSSDKIWPDSTGNRTYQVHVVFMHLSQLHMYM